MQQDASIAGAALILVQLCVAVIMFGVYWTTPGERCTRDWALSGAYVAIGIFLGILNDGKSALIAVLASGALILGAVQQWAGIRAFYKKPRSWYGWLLGGAFLLLYAVIAWQSSSAGNRVMTLRLELVVLLLLGFHEILRTQKGGIRGPAALTLGAMALLIACHLWRASTAEMRLIDITQNRWMSISFFYLIPLVGTMLQSFGFLLLYFERMVADKHQLATHDDLTGVFNRRAIVAIGERSVETALRTRQPLAIAFVDIDYFKQVNDNHGHETGDRVLIAVAKALMQSCRAIDVVGRYGGEEFCIILPGTSPDVLAGIGDRLLEAVRAHDFGNAGARVTISVGLAALSGLEQEQSWMRLIADADRELYRAKAAGRNCYSIAPAQLKTLHSTR